MEMQHLQGEEHMEICDLHQQAAMPLILRLLKQIWRIFCLPQTGAIHWVCVSYLILGGVEARPPPVFRHAWVHALQNSNVQRCFQICSVLIVSVFFWLAFRRIECYRVAQRRCFLSFKDPEIRGTPGCIMLLHISQKLLGLTECTTCRDWFLLFNDMSLDSVQPCFHVNCLLCPNRGCWNFSQQFPGERQGQRTTSTTAKWKTVSEFQTLRARLSCSPV